MDAKYDGEGACRQHVLLVVVKKAVCCCQRESVANLEEKKNILNQLIP